MLANIEQHIINFFGYFVPLRNNVQMLGNPLNVCLVLNSDKDVLPHVVVFGRGALGFTTDV